jgi:multicomponent Na+:H+ antiporter subunit D
MSPESSFWIICPVLLPLLAGIITFLLRRGAFWVCLAASVLNGMAVVALLIRLLADGPFRYSIGGWPAPLGITLQTDGPSLLLLLMTAVTGLGITLYGHGYFSFRIAAPKRIGRHEKQQRYFWPLWMMLWAGLNGLYLAGDVFNIYVTLEIVGIAAASLAALSGKPASQIAAFRYLLVSLLGSLSYLLGVTLLYKTFAVLDFAMLKIAAAAIPGARAALALMTIGLLLKTALFPMHFWLPPAHANALAPVSAILSALVIKGSFYLVFRFWFDIFNPIVSGQVMECMGLLGCGAILWGAIQAVRQQRLKLLVAYSTVSQLGYLFVAFPLVRLEGDARLWGAVLFMALGHAWAKSAMFMATGSVFLHLGHDRINDLSGVRAFLPVTVFAYAIAGVNLMGLPPTAGFVAKWLLLSSSFRSSEWWWGLVIMVGSLLASIYVFKVVSRFFMVVPGSPVGKRQPHSALIEWPALALAMFSFLLGIVTPSVLLILKTGGGIIKVAGGLP